MILMQVERIVRNGRVAVLPDYAGSGAAAMDLRAFLEEPIRLLPRGRVLVATGLKIAVPIGMAGLILARSGLASKMGLTLANGVGLIDSDYRGELMVSLLNTSREEYLIRDGDRIAQLMLIPAPPFAFLEAEQLDDTERGDGGFGSTGG